MNQEGEISMNRIIRMIIIFLISVLTGYLTGRYTTPERERIVTVQGKEHVVYKDRVVVKDHIVTKTVVKEVSGKITEVTKVEDKSGTKSDLKRSDIYDTRSIVERQSSEPNYSVGVGMRHNFASSDPLSRTPEFTLGRRLIGGVWMRTTITKTDASVGVSVDL